MDRARLCWARSAAAAAARVRSEGAKEMIRLAMGGSSLGCGRECVALTRYRPVGNKVTDGDRGTMWQGMVYSLPEAA